MVLKSLLAAMGSLGSWYGSAPRVRQVQRDPNSPRIAAAEAKRNRKAQTLYVNTCRSWEQNHAHGTHPRLDPFFIG